MSNDEQTTTSEQRPVVATRLDRGVMPWWQRVWPWRTTAAEAEAFARLDAAIARAGKLAEENAHLRAKVARQRRELRRLNCKGGHLWAGARWALAVKSADERRAKMISAFGLNAVLKAEGEA